MGATAQLNRVAAGLQHPHHLAVLLAEEGDGAQLLGPIEGRLEVAARGVVEHLGVDQVLHLGDLLGGEGLVMAEVEAEPVGADPGSLLLDVLAEDLPQRPMQDVGGGVVAADTGPALGVDGCGHPVADLQLALDGLDDVDMQLVDGVHGVGDPRPGPGRLARDLAGVPDLAAALGVERRAIQNDPPAGGVQHLSLRRQLGPPAELGRTRGGQQGHERRHIVGGGHRTGTAGPFLLLGHRGREALCVHLDASLRGDLHGDLEGEAVRVVQQEGDIAVDPLARREAGHSPVEDGLSGAQRLAEPLLLAVDHVSHVAVVAGQVRVGLGHHVHHGVDHAAHDGIGHAQQVGVAHGSPDDAPQHVAAVLVGGEHAVAHQQRCGPGVIGEYPERHVAGLGFAQLGPGEALGRVEKGHELVGLPHRVNALEHGHGALKTQASVDRRLGQRDLGTVGGALELHEHEVPDLDVALLAAVGGAAARAVGGPLVPEDLRARAAGADVGHAPVVVLAEALDPLGGHADLVAPDGLGLVVTEVNRHPEPLGVEAQHAGDELPGPGTGVGLEVVAEAEVAEHLEEGQVPGGASNLIEVVVLAAGPHALLDGDGPREGGRLLAREVRLERHHAGHREQQGRIVGDQAGRGMVGVAPLDEEVDEGLSDLRRGHRLHRSRAPGSGPPPSSRSSDSVSRMASRPSATA